MPPLQRPLVAALLLAATVLVNATAQAITPSPAQFNLSAPTAGVAEPATLSVTSTGTPLLVSISVNTFGTGNWLFVSPQTLQTPASYIVSANAMGLAPGTYNGQILLSAPGAVVSPVAVPVSFTVGSGTAAGISVTPTSLSFFGQTGGAIPAAQTLSVVSTLPGTGFAVSTTTDTTLKWLQASPVSGIAPAPVTVSILSAGLAPGNYNGSVLITPASGNPVSIPVTLALSAGNVLSVSASNLQFFYQIGSFQPGNQSFTVGSSAGTSINFATTPTTNDGRQWLTVSPNFANTPANVTVGVNAAPLGPGVYSGKVNISAPAAGNSYVDVPVTLTVANGPLITAGTFPSRFVHVIGNAPPQPQLVRIGSTGDSLQYYVTAATTGPQGWLVITPSSGATPQDLSIGVNPTGLAAGTYSATVNVQASGALNSPLAIPITLTVSDSSSVAVSVPSVQINYQVGGSNQVLSQTVRVTSTGQPVTVSASAAMSTCGSNWLRVYPTQFDTPASITVNTEPLGFTTPQECNGVVVLTPVGGGSAIQIPVTLKVTTTPVMNISPLSLNFSALFDGSPAVEQTVALSMTDNSAVPFNLTPISIGSNWLRLSATNGNTPAMIRVTADPNNVGVGNYSTAIMVSSPALASTQAITVNFSVTSNIKAAVNPLALSFEQVFGSGPPAAQVLNVTTAGGATSYTVTTSTSNSVGWLSATPNIGTTPGTISVGVNGTNLQPGSYSGSIVITLPAAANSPLLIPITFNVLRSQTLNASPASLSFTYRLPGSPPASQQLRITTAGDPLVASASAVTQNGGSWLSVTPASGRTAVTFDVAINPAGLGAGVYTGTVNITAPASPNSPLLVPVRLEVIGPPAPSITTVFNAASGAQGSIAPGEIVTITGAGLGPANGAELRLQDDNTVATQVEGTRVLFETYAAPILYTSAGQINVVVPYEVSGMNSVRVVVEYQGIRSVPVAYQTSATAPGIFTTTQTGKGQGAILNQNSSYNAVDTPAERGSIVQVFATGEGVVNPAAPTGSVTSTGRTPVARVRATVGGTDADVVFAGAAPGAVAGLLQVNVRIPPNVPVGSVPIVLNIGGVSSQAAVTVAVR